MQVVKKHTVISVAQLTYQNQNRVNIRGAVYWMWNLRQEMSLRGSDHHQPSLQP